MTREIRADNTTDTLYTYDLAGHLKTITDPKDQVTTHSYNVDDSLSGTAYTNATIATPSVAYTYDAYYPRVATMVDGIGTTTYTYKAPSTNGAGQVATIDSPLANDTIAYAYDELGRVTQRTINGTANQVDWTFDALGRVTSETNLLGAFTYAYDGVTNRLATVTYPNGQTSAYSYFNNAGDRRLQTIHHKYPNASTLSKFDYTYDAVGNILTWRQQADSTAVLWEYGYDPADQLTSAIKNSTATPSTVLQRFAYAYDPAGNRTVEQIDDQITLSAYDNLNRLTSQAPGGPMVIAGSLNEPGTVTISGVPAVVDANNNFRGTIPTTTGTNAFTIVAKDASGNTTTHQYEVDLSGSGRSFVLDANGNLVDDGVRLFEWNSRNQLVAIESGTTRLDYAYDGDQRRVSADLREAGVLQSQDAFVWCKDAVCEDRPVLGTALLRRTFGDGEQVGAGALFFTADQLGSVSDILDSSASVLGHYAYDPWGRRVVTTGSAVTAYGYTGHLWDSLAAGWMAEYRVYDPGLARWFSEDPAGPVDGPNKYAYVRNRPTTLLDRKGLWAGGVGAGLSAAAAVVWGVTGEASATPVFDSQGNVGLLVCGTGGIGNGLSISAGAQVQSVACPQCKSICDLEGPCFGLAGHIAKGPGISVGGAICVGSSGFTANLSAGPAAGIGVFGGAAVGSCKLIAKRKPCCS